MDVRLPLTREGWLEVLVFLREEVGAAGWSCSLPCLGPSHKAVSWARKSPVHQTVPSLGERGGGKSSLERPLCTRAASLASLPAARAGTAARTSFSFSFCNMFT